jgi:hypothetical protein
MVTPQAATPVATVSAISATAMTTSTTTGAAPGPVTIHGGDERSLAEFLRQYLIAPFVPDESSTTVYIGTLPPDLPFTLELPAGLSVAGSVVTTGEYASSQLLFHLEGDVSESVSALRQQVESQGFTRSARANAEIFQSQPPDEMPLCNSDNTLSLMVHGRNLADGTGIIRVYINQIDPANSPCAMSPVGGADAYERVMPSLAAPANIGTFSSGISSGGDALEATIGFRGDTTIAALAEHYHAQLEAAGWQQLGNSQTEDMAWSGWSVTEGDQSYTATFYLVRDAGSSDRFRASLRLERAR